ncbi:hypothetical protein EUGRSUZ_C01872 [Eucalyptus grandis]|uniref:Uncharacterized protein n=2 Tax=Eucalyptus grandis TaxID=71139 RepID=A0ACC3LEL8_EUCGR|nr:hypothetical protein EUGRSUZ_C01872 [Eucalyptus grandis]
MICQFLLTNITMKMRRAKTATTPAIKNRPQKLSRPKLLEIMEEVESRQLVSDVHHAFSILVIGPSVTLRIAREMSGTSGDPLGKTCKPKEAGHEIFQSKK